VNASDCVRFRIVETSFEHVSDFVSIHLRESKKSFVAVALRSIALLCVLPFPRIQPAGPWLFHPFNSRAKAPMRKNQPFSVCNTARCIPSIADGHPRYITIFRHRGLQQMLTIAL
jgi:hypothetical protein